MIVFGQVRKYIDVYFNIFSWALLLTMRKKHVVRWTTCVENRGDCVENGCASTELKNIALF